MKNKTFSEKVITATNKAEELLNAVTDLEQGKRVSHVYIASLITDIITDELDLIQIIRNYELEKIYSENLLTEDNREGL